MHATINYWLTETGRKASILAGGDGAEKQTVRVERDDTLFPRIVEAGNVGNDCVTLDVGSPYSDRRFATPQTAEQLVAYVDAEKAAAAAEESRRVEEKRQATLAVRNGRQTRATKHSHAWGDWTELAPDWPYNADAEIVGSDDSKAWTADLGRCNAESQAACEALRPAYEAEQKRLADETTTRKAEAAAKRSARCVELGGEADDLLLAVEDGALSQVPSGCWESHRRGKNWLAVVSPNPSSPGGLERSFQDKAKGSSYYMVSGLSVGDAVEFGADYYSGGGRKSPTRWYGFVVAKTADSMVLRKFAGGKTAHKAAQKFLETYVAPPVSVNSEGAIADPVAEAIARVNGN